MTIDLKDQRVLSKRLILNGNAEAAQLSLDVTVAYGKYRVTADLDTDSLMLLKFHIDQMISEKAYGLELGQQLAL